jgi:DNA-binding PadR family transcriptional regulator
MLILDRDRQIVMSVARFGQLATDHVRCLHFHEAKSLTRMYDALNRLVERKYLARIERRMRGGTGAGSSQYVYQLGRAGWALARREGAYWPARAVKPHTLAVADAYCELLELERAKRITIDGFRTEPDSWGVVGGVELRPDLYMEVIDPHRQSTVHLWLEVDMGTERTPQIKTKLADYWRAYEASDESVMPSSTAVVFIAPDDDRAHELNWIIRQGREDQQALFFAFTAQTFARYIFP